jgi:hypothetical protein
MATPGNGLAATVVLRGTKLGDRTTGTLGQRFQPSFLGQFEILRPMRTPIDAP